LIICRSRTSCGIDGERGERPLEVDPRSHGGELVAGVVSAPIAGSPRITSRFATSAHAKSAAAASAS
jgi:hypothetical protein